jgi:transcriptional regulator with XRE-family HTH domain
MGTKRAVKVLRVERGVTQTALARALRISRNRMLRIEAKQTPATPAERDHIARRLKVDPTELDVEVDERGRTPGPRPRLAAAS